VRPSLNARAVAERCGTNEPHIRRLAREGHIPHFRIGRKYRFDPDELDAWLAAVHVEPVVSR
jgi:excisionase family DNA binding protein